MPVHILDFEAFRQSGFFESVLVLCSPVLVVVLRVVVLLTSLACSLMSTVLVVCVSLRG